MVVIEAKAEVQKEMRKQVKRQLRAAQVEADKAERLAAHIVDLAKARNPWPRAGRTRDPRESGLAVGAETKIEWTDHTFNPWIGCTKIDPVCTNCYAADDTFASNSEAAAPS